MASTIGIASELPLWPFVALLVIVAAGAAAFFSRPRVREPACPFVVEPKPASFDWRKTPTFRYRPFKPVYHMVMNITKTSESDWLRIENTYDHVTEVHKQILVTHPTETCRIDDTPTTAYAMQELYNTVFGVLVQQYPMLFVVQGNEILNVVKGVRIPRYAAASKLDTKTLLQILVENTEEDFQLLEFSNDEDEFMLRAVGGLTSDAFSWASKVGMKLTDVHGPVPFYKEKLKMSMNRYFKKIEPGKFIERFTWGIHIGSADMKHHIKDKYAETPELEEADIDFENNVFLRVERQVPTKLADSGFLILSQHTHFYPISEVKEEGLGPALADGIDAWPEWFAAYKGRPEWGRAVTAWLRRE